MPNLTIEDLPNPFTPMAFLPPDLAYQKTVTTYVAVGGLSVLIWDIITHLRADWKMTVGLRFRLPIGVYHLSRLSTLIHALTNVIFETAPAQNCSAFIRISCAVYHIALSSTAFLFFLRVRAVFGRNKYFTVPFFILWLSVFAGSLTVIISLSGSHIGPTKYCTISDFKPYGGSANITTCIYDTAVFGAIAWRLLSDAPAIPGAKGRFGLFLPRFSRAFLQDGQNYYMVAMISNLLVLAMNYVSGISMIYRTMFFVPTVGLTNIVACSVFRNVKSGRYDETSTSHARGVPTVSIAFAVRSEHSDTDSSVSRDPNPAPSSGYPAEKPAPTKQEDSPV